MKQEAGVLGSVDAHEHGDYPERHVMVYVDGKRIGRASKILDLYDQARTGGRSLKDVIQTAKGLSKVAALIAAALLRDETSKYAALAYAILYPAWADVRQCELMPGEVHILTENLSPGLHTVSLKFQGVGPGNLDSYDQIWHYVPIHEGKETVLYCRSGPDKCMQYVQVKSPAPATAKR
jgi:hypothetical protein